MNSRKADPQIQKLTELEAHLAGTLKKVQPPSGMVQRLQGRIQFPDRAQITVRLKDWRTLVFVFGGVMSGMMLLITLARALYYLTRRSTL